MLPIFLCHYPSGISINQYLHFMQTVAYEYFGKYKHDSRIPSDFPISRITTPISLHLTNFDGLINTDYTIETASKFQNLIYVQVINDTIFNHIDFSWGINANALVYSKILAIFNRYQENWTFFVVRELNEWFWTDLNGKKCWNTKRI